MAQETRKIYTTDCPSYSLWFERFIKGVHKRMGEEVKSDYALSAEVVKNIETNLDESYQAAHNVKDRKRIEEIAWIVLVGYLIGLRGEEIVKMKVDAFLRFLDDGLAHATHPHVIMPLQGRFKVETGERWHMLPVAARTKSGLDVEKWAKRLAASLRERKRTKGFVLANMRGNQARIAHFGPEFVKVLEEVRERQPQSIPAGLDLEEDFGLSRSMRHGSTTETANQGLAKTAVEANNRRRKYEMAKGSAPSLDMMGHYMQASQMVPILIAYSACL